MVYGSEKCIIGNLLRFKSDLQKKSVVIKLDGYNKSKTYDFEHNALRRQMLRKVIGPSEVRVEHLIDPRTFW